jgi:DNA repair protein RecO (recombination protein O)
MIERAAGIILRTRLLTETSLIAHWLTPEFGRVATVAKGARRSNSPFRGKLDLFYVADFSFARSRRSDLHTLREVSLNETHPALRQDLARLQHASYCTALIEQTTETQTPIPEVHGLFLGFIRHLAQHWPSPLDLFAFEMKLLHHLGQNPDLAASTLTPGVRQILARTAELDWPELSRLKPSESQVRELQQFLYGFIVFHLGKIPKGRGAALAGRQVPTGGD